jgi:UPF0716 protein FxsA
VVAGLFVFFLTMTIVEIAVLIKVGSVIGVLPTLAVLVGVSFLGAWLAKREGFLVLARVRDRIEAGQVPGTELVDGALVVTGAILLITPGFVTDCIGILLLLPPSRLLARRFAMRRIARRVRVFRVVGSGRGTARPAYDDVIDV